MTLNFTTVDIPDLLHEAELTNVEWDEQLCKLSMYFRGLRSGRDMKS
jgi:hypothetical protein